MDAVLKSLITLISCKEVKQGHKGRTETCCYCLRLFGICMVHDGQVPSGCFISVSHSPGDERTQDEPRKKQQEEVWKCLGAALLCTLLLLPLMASFLLLCTKSSCRSDWDRKIPVR